MCSEGWTSWGEINKRAIASRSKYGPKIVDAGLYDNEQSEAKVLKICGDFFMAYGRRMDAVKTEADSLVCKIEKQLKELGDQVPLPVKEKVNSELQKVKDAISGESIKAIRNAVVAANEEAVHLSQPL